MVADAALGRAAAQVVLDAVAGEDLDRAVVHVDREVDGELAARLAQDEAHARVEVEAVGGEVELSLGDFPGVDGQRRARWSWKENLRVGRPSWATSRVWVVSRTTPRGVSPAATGPGAGRRCDARLMCGPEYSRRSAPPGRPHRYRSARLSQPCRNLVRRSGRRSGSGEQDRRADAARAEVRPDRRADELDRHCSGRGRRSRRTRRGTPRRPADTCGGSTAARSAARSGQLDDPLARLARVRTRSTVSTTPCLTSMIGLTDRSVPMAAWAPLIRPPFLRYSRVSRVR